MAENISESRASQLKYKQLKKLLIFLSIPLIAIILLIVGNKIYYQVSCRDIPDRKIAETIPRYPDVKYWAIIDGTYQCFISDGTPSADVSFYTPDNKEKVLTFYKEQLPKTGWRLNEESENSVFWASFIKDDDLGVTAYLTDGPSTAQYPDANFHITVKGKHTFYQNR